MLAYHLLHTIEHQLATHYDHRSWRTIKETLSTHQRVTISFDRVEAGTTRCNHLQVCSTPEPQHKEIDRMLGIGTVPVSQTLMKVANS